MLGLSLAYLRDRWLNSALNAALLALGIATITALILFDGAMRERLARDARGIDLVVGAKGSPMQLILSAIYHLDVPTGNIPAGAAAELARHPMVAKVMPLALGDSVSGFRIVGTETSYPTHYGAELSEGRYWRGAFEATLGAEAARRLGLGIGDTFVGSHGLAAGGPRHGGEVYEVVGVLKPSGSVLDRLVLTAVESVWEVHGAMHSAQDNDEEEGEITVLLVTYRTPLAAVRLPRQVNAKSALQAAAPAFEMARLFALVGAGVDTIRGFGLLLVATAALGVFIALTGAMRERRYDIAVMRSLGASRGAVLAQVLSEGLILTLAGTALGLALGHAAAEVLSRILPEARAMGLGGGVFETAEFYLIALAVAVGLLAAALPAAQAYRTDVAATLAAR
jgi:putative ABC transport system permease protein